MSDSTPRLGLPDLPDTPELYADTVADAFWRLDALSDLCLKGAFVNAPPSSPADGDAWLIGGAPTGAWSGYPYKIASCRDGGWQMLTPCNGLRGWVADSGRFIVYQDGAWTDWNSLIGAGEAAIASAATCDIGAAGSLFLQVTGTTAITAFGTAANALRFLRFAGSLTLTYNATSLILPGAANIVTAAGDVAIFASDSSGNWRCRQYSRASGLPVSLASPTVTGTLTAAAANFSGAVTMPAGAKVADAAPYFEVRGSTNGAFRGYQINDGSTTLAQWSLKASTGEVQFAAGFAAFGAFYTWYRDGSEAMRLDATGLGIGVTATSPLSIKATNTVSDGGIRLIANASTATIGVLQDGGGYGLLSVTDMGANFANLRGNGVIECSATIASGVYTVATLPAGSKAMRAFVSDANSATFNTAAAGGGSNNVPVFHDGSAWRIG